MLVQVERIINYPPIVVSISGNTGIGTTNGLTFNSTIKPNFRGPITKINLQQGGIGYGCSNVLDFERQPLITFENGSSPTQTNY